MIGTQHPRSVSPINQYLNLHHAQTHAWTHPLSLLLIEIVVIFIVIVFIIIIFVIIFFSSNIGITPERHNLLNRAGIRQNASITEALCAATADAYLCNIRDCIRWLLQNLGLIISLTPGNESPPLKNKKKK